MGAFSPPLRLTGKQLDAWTAPALGDGEDELLGHVADDLAREPAATEPADDPGEALDLRAASGAAR